MRMLNWVAQYGYEGCYQIRWPRLESPELLQTIDSFRACI